MPVGYVIAEVLDDALIGVDRAALHVEQVSVDPGVRPPAPRPAVDRAGRRRGEGAEPRGIDADDVPGRALERRVLRAVRIHGWCPTRRWASGCAGCGRTRRPSASIASPGSPCAGHPDTCGRRVVHGGHPGTTRQTGPVPGVELLTVGHGTLPADDLAALLTGQAVALLVDVRSYPGSRRHPQFGRAEHGAVAARCRRRLPLGAPPRRPAARTARQRERRPAQRGLPGLRRPHDDGRVPRRRSTGCWPRRRSAAPAVMCSESLWWRLPPPVAGGRGDPARRRGGRARHARRAHRAASAAPTGFAATATTSVYDVGGTVPLPM